MKISNELNLLLQCSSLFFAILFNSILIYLIITKSPKKMGNYKALMIYFSTFSMLFAVIDMIVRPFIHSHGNCFFMIMSTKDWPFSEDSAQIAISVLCGCGGVTPFLIAIHFIYRFFALERKGRLRYFSGKYLIFWFIIPVLGGVNWFHLSWFYYRRNEKTTEYIRQTVLDNFGLHMNETVYSAAFFYPPDGQGIPQLDWSIFISYIILSISMALPFSIMIIAGVMSHSKIKKLLEHGECDYTKRLQLQLYKALVVQTFLPVFLFFLPLGALFTAPLFHVDIGSWSYVTTYLYALYPAVDPLPIMFIVQEYRLAFYELFDCFRCTVPAAKVEDNSTMYRESEAV
ncbi:Protein CBR-STR-166 [Caenorhabditis briggsae]|uniref:Serpentine receptor class r-10 n=1 Tax=Caenorhabditis briggsae TaxID=6238 RepID=A8XDS7_CAEBR|nr:Protein CBR-STR-166 [Caenorhabditis briggsae]CAP30797.1 Protein CBR-STR-166 [Caenorhabditis briggsae]